MNTPDYKAIAERLHHWLFCYRRLMPTLCDITEEEWASTHEGTSVVEALAAYTAAKDADAGDGWLPINTITPGEYVLLRIPGPHKGNDGPDVVVGMQTRDGDYWLTAIWAGTKEHKEPTHWRPRPPAPRTTN